MNADLAVTIECPVHFKATHRGRKRMKSGEAPEVAPPVPEGNVPRVSLLMALAIRFDGLISSGIARDYSDLARLGRVTRARMTQIMNLLNLAPDIQEAILHLPRTVKGYDPITERNLRPIVAEQVWSRQRKMWRQIITNHSSED